MKRSSRGWLSPEEEEEESLQTPGATDFHDTHCMPEPVPEGRAPKFVGWEKVLHPSQPVVAAGDIPSTNQDPKAEGGIEPDLPNDTHKAASLPSPVSTSVLPVDTGLGTHVAANPTMWLLWHSS